MSIYIIDTCSRVPASSLVTGDTVLVWQATSQSEPPPALVAPPEGPVSESLSVRPWSSVAGECEGARGSTAGIQECGMVDHKCLELA